MEKSAILRRFLEKGLQLDYESLDFFSKNQKEIETFLGKILQGEKPAIVSLSYVHDTLRDQNEDIKVLKFPQKTKSTLSIEESTKILNDRYTFIKKILGSRLDLINPISLNKITAKTKHFSTIVMAMEKVGDERAIVAEDETGERKFFFENAEDYDQIVLDDVIGVVCRLDERPRIESVIWPDIQMKRSINRTPTDVSVAVVAGRFDEKVAEGIANKRKEVNHVIFVDENGEIECTNETKTDTLSPATLEVEKKIIFLVSGSGILKKYGQISDDEEGLLTSMLKRRNIDPTFELENFVFEQDPYLIETIPDVFVVAGTKKNISANYKGTTIIGAQNFEKSKSFWIINLKSRETINASLE